MKYLFFDIECADGNRAICEYGYVLTDEKLNVIRKCNILIDPECRISLTGREHQADLLLTYTSEEYRRHYPFDDAYKTIKKLMTQDDLLIFGHSVENDIRYINKDCKRYNLPMFEYVAYDIQKMLPKFDKSNRSYTSLENAFAELVPQNVRSELRDHRACDDAMKTMLVFKAMVHDLEFSPNDLIEACPNAVFNSLQCWEETLVKREMKKKKLKREADRKVANNMWSELFHAHQSLLEDPNLMNKHVSVTHEMRAHLVEFTQLITIIKEKGYVACEKISDSNYFIAFDDKNRKQLLASLKEPYSGEILTYQEFVDLNK